MIPAKSRSALAALLLAATLLGGCSTSNKAAVPPDNPYTDAVGAGMDTATDASAATGSQNEATQDSEKAVEDLSE